MRRFIHTIGGFLVEQGHEQHLFHFTRFKTEGTSSTLIRHTTIAIDDIESRRHAAIRVTGRVINFIYQERDLILQ